MDKFPHLSDTKFPRVNNVNPYSFQNNFDYTRWEPGTKLKLCNVNWCGDYENVVKFEDDAARDKYFDNLATPVHQLESAMRVLPHGMVKLPVPFDEMINFNYLVVDFSTATSEENPLPYSRKGNSKFFYFVHDVKYSAPSTTECYLDLDVWTTYVNHVDINYMMLSRGHAPMAETTVNDYLDNPIKNNKYLLADDVNYGEPAVVTNSDFVPFGSGKKYVLVATTCPFEKLINSTSTAISPSDPGFYSLGTRDGADAGVSGEVIAAGRIDYSNIKLFTDTSHSTTGYTPNGYSVYAVKGSEFFAFITAFATEQPQAMKALAAVYVVDESMIILGESFTFLDRHTMTWRELANSGQTWNSLYESNHTYAEIDKYANDYFGEPRGFTVYNVSPNNGLIKQLELKKEDFGYPEEYADIAKLYTFPYAAIEVSDDSGATSVIKIEDTGALNIFKRVSLAYPYINFSAFIEGVGGNSQNEYTWKKLTGNEAVSSISSSDFRKYLFDYDIPTFELFQQGYDAFRANNYNANNVIPITQKVLAYENKIKSINTSYQNELDSINKDFTNTNASIDVNKSNANRSALAGYQNALASNATGQTNTNASNATSYENSVKNANTGLANTNDSNATSYANSVKNADTGLANTNDSNTTSYENSVKNADTGLTNTNESNKTNLQINTLRNALRITQVLAQNTLNTSINLKNNKASSDITNNSISLTTELTSIDNEVLDSQIWGSILPDTYQAISAAASPIFAGLGAAYSSASIEQIPNTIANAAISGMQSTTQNILGFGSDAAANTIIKSVNTRKMTRNNNAATTATEIANQLRTDVNDLQKSNSNTMAKTQNENDTEVANKNADTSNANAQRSRDTSVSTSAASRDTSNSNAQRSYSTTLSTSAASRDTSNANAQRSRDTSVSTSAASRDTSNANAQRSRTTGDSNALRTYQNSLANSADSASTSRINAQRDKDLARANAKYKRDRDVENAQLELANEFEVIRQTYLDHKLDAPITVASASGDASPDELAWRGIQVKVKTQKPGEIAPAGDQMLRFGYMLGQVWNFTKFTLMKHFTYWKCEDLWLTGGEGVIEGAQEQIKNILKAGVTIWANPDEIGSISIYENLE